MKIPFSPSPATRREAVGLFVLVALVFATRAPFLMHGLDEWDSANFALSLVHFDVMAHQPHPPGQYLYVRLLQFLNVFTGNELLTLSLGSALCSSLALVPYYLALRQVFRPTVALGAAVLTAFTFGFWVTSLRMISDPVACLFVYGVVCALLAGVTNRGWFVFGMTLCGLTLGVKQTSVYFLAPFAVAVNLVVLYRHGWRRPLLGSLGFALAVAAWLLPTISNCQGWSRYVAATRTMQKENYDIESIIFHLSPAAAQAQAQQNFLQPWGATSLAVVMLALAAGGLVVCCRRGLRGWLFALFGVTMALYTFFFLYHFNKYYVYDVPFYCALAAAALFAGGDFLARRTGRPRLRHLVPGAAIALVTVANIALTAPLLPKIARFRAPPQAALEALRGMPGAGPDPLLLTDEVTPGRELLYFHLKKKVDLLIRHPDLRDAAAALNAGRKVYFLSPTAFDTDPAQGNAVRRLGHYEWPEELYQPLQGRADLLQLSLYELMAPLPVAYRFDTPASHAPLLEEGMSEDGWCGVSARFVLPCSKTGASLVRLQLTSPEEAGFRYPYRLVCQFVGGLNKELTVEHAGGSDFIVPVPDQHGAPTVEMQMSAPQIFRSHDPRLAALGNLSVHLDDVVCVTDSSLLVIQRGSGWYAPETDGSMQWRWSDDNGTLTVLTDRAGTLVLQGSVRSVSPGNALDILVDDLPPVAEPLPASGWEPIAWLLPVAGGFHRITLHSRNPAMQPPGDNRHLAVCWRDLQVRLQP